MIRGNCKCNLESSLVVHLSSEGQLIENQSPHCHGEIFGELPNYFHSFVSGEVLGSSICGTFMLEPPTNMLEMRKQAAKRNLACLSQMQNFKRRFLNITVLSSMLNCMALFINGKINEEE